MTKRMLSHQRSSFGQDCAGFTLLEMLVALALLSLVMLGLTSTMITVSQTQSRITERFDEMDKQLASIEFLRQILGQVSAQRKVQESTNPQVRNIYFFEGLTQSVAWLGVMPARWGVGGMTYFRLSLQPIHGRQALVVEHAPWKGQEPDVRAMQQYVLDDAVEHFELAYKSGSAGQLGWSPEWKLEQELPNAIEIKLQTAKAVWPKIIISVHSPLLHHPRARGGAVLGGH